MGISGILLKDEFYFQPGLERTYRYDFTTNSGNTQDYELYVRMYETDLDLTEYVTLDTYYVEDVPTGASYPFKAHLKLPDRIDTPGVHEIRVGASETENLGGGNFGVKTAAEARIIINVLYQGLFAFTGFSAPNANVDSVQKYRFKVHNFGTEEFDASGRVEVMSQDSELILGTARTETKHFKSKEHKALVAEFNTTGLSPGLYTARGILQWGDNVSEFERQFVLGTKELELMEYRSSFPQGSIYKGHIEVKSGWGSEMKNVFAELIVLDEVGSEEVSMRTLGDTIKPWRKATLEGYLDTTDLEERQYEARIVLHYDGITRAHDMIVNITEPLAIETSPDTEEGEERNVTVIVLTAIVIILVAILGLLGFIMWRRR